MAELIPATPGSLVQEQLDRTLGVYFIGYLFMMVLYGYTFFQSYLYYSRYPRDFWAIKATVAFLFCLDTAVSVLLSHSLYYYMVDLFPYTLTVEFATTPFCTQLILATICIFVAQMYYASTVWSATKNAIVSGVIVMLATGGLVLGVVMSVKLIKDRDFSHMAQSTNKVTAGVTHGLFAAAGLLSFVFLSVSRLPNSFTPIKTPYDAFVSYLISRGGLAVIVQIVLTFVFVGTSDKIYWFPFHATATKLFVVGAITLLNSREGGEVNLGTEDWGSSMGATHTIGGTTIGNGTVSGLEFNHKPIVIEVAQSTQQDMDKIDYGDDNRYVGGKEYTH